MRQVKDRFIARLLTRYPALFKAWESRSTGMSFEDSPWSPLAKPIEECRVALVTTGGIHLYDQTAFDMENPNGDHSYREIPAGVNPNQLKITHNYYDHAEADADVNIVFPIERIMALEKTNEVASINHRHFSFMGHILNDQLDLLLTQSAPEVARLLKEDGVDIVILSPA